MSLGPENDSKSTQPTRISSHRVKFTTIIPIRFRAHILKILYKRPLASNRIEIEHKVASHFSTGVDLIVEECKSN